MTALVESDTSTLEDKDVLLICEIIPLELEEDIIETVPVSAPVLASELQLESTAPSTEMLNEVLPSNEVRPIQPRMSDWNHEKYRNSFEPEKHWDLRRKFIEQHKCKIPEAELVALAQAFVNVEILGTVYSEEMMTRLDLLGSAIAKDYRRYKRCKPKRVTVLATVAAKDWIHQRSKRIKLCERRSFATHLLSPVFPVTSIEDVYRNFVLLDDDLEESGREFEKLGCGWIVHDMRRNEQLQQWEATVTVAGYLLVEVAGPFRKLRHKCQEVFLNLLRKKCYKVKTNPNRPWDSCNVERLESDQELDWNGNPYDRRLLVTASSKDQLREDNVGFRLLRKLGWGGGPLGKHQDGILDPIEVQAKRGRRGLGLPQLSLKPQQPDDSRFAHVPVNNNALLDGLDLTKIPFRIDVCFYKDLMRNFKTKKLGYDLIFSADFSETERGLLVKIASDLELHCTTITYDYENYQFVLMKHRMSPHELLVKLLVEKNHVYRSLYTVEPPEDGLFEYNEILELCS
ncbi:uncharacterized protein LOC129733873 [Wyeomyia smithii]|uniref:uncharacterized protein LOC129733873 n=1 Tax=Wyeomyia smithii TaxID=174621 RepID=UPI002467C103|nr:uncharacterized protein LOC129733873 [Wyeomyia smithii]